HMPGMGTGPPPKSDLAPAGNPFPGPDPYARLVFAYGFRNPFRFTIDPETNDLFIGDVGLSTWEEMNELTYAGYTGNNYGGPECGGRRRAPEPQNSNCSQGPFVGPIYVSPNAAGPAPSAVVGGPLYRRVLGSPVSFGSDYDGNIFLCEFYAKWIRRLVRSGS